MSPPPAITTPLEFEVAQEDDTVASRKVTTVTSATVAITIAAVAISGWIVSFITGRLDGRTAHAARAAGMAPRQIAGIHQTPIETDRHGWEQREQQRRSLETYRWVDRDRGIAQIPIERAMQMIIDDAARQRGAQ